MNFTTHQAAGIVAAEATLLLVPFHVSLWVYPVAIVGGFLLGPFADIDKKESKIGQALIFISTLLEAARVRHRTFTHSLLALAIMWWLLDPLGSPPDICALKMSLIAAYASHPLIDMLNPQGVEILFPLPFRIKLLPEILAISVQTPESIGETMFRWLLSIIMFVEGVYLFSPLVLHLPILGPIVSYGMGLLASAVKNFM